MTTPPLRLGLLATLLLACTAFQAAPPSQPLSLPATSAPSTTPSTKPVTPLPLSWHGKFEGTAESLRPGKPPQPIVMGLHISPIEGTPTPHSSVNWIIIYGTGQDRQERPYRLDAIPGYPNRFLMDERNGIFIDHALVGNSLISQFIVGTSLLYCRFERTPEGIEVEITSFQTNPTRKSTPAGTNITVESFPTATVQKGLLKEVKP